MSRVALHKEKDSAGNLTMRRALARASSTLVAAAAATGALCTSWQTGRTASDAPGVIKVDSLRTVYSPLPNRTASHLLGKPLVLARSRSATEQLGDISSLIGSPLYTTASHQQILIALVHQASLLQQGRFKGSNGAHARLLHGPKGIGKTFMLRAFAAVCQEAFPDVIPVYITFGDKGLRASWLRELDIMEAVAKQLARHGVDVKTDEDTSPPVAVFEALERQGKKLLLLVDEIDQLYRVSPQDIEFDSARSSLACLAFVGDRGGAGVVSAVLCGSSAICPFLVTANAHAGWMRAEFPLVVGAPNLNGQKYRIWRVSAPLPHDIDSVRDLLSARSGCRATVGEARMAAFVAGGAARDVAKVAEEQFAAMGLDTKLLADKETALRKLETTGGRFYKALMVALVEKNTELVAALTTDGLLDPRRVARTKWESMLSPLAWKDAVRCWQALAHANKATADDMVELQSELLDLCDRGWLVVDRIKLGKPECVYPAACAQLFSHHINPAEGKKWDAWLAELLARDVEFGVTLFPPSGYVRVRPSPSTE